MDSKLTPEEQRDALLQAGLKYELLTGEESQRLQRCVSVLLGAQDAKTAQTIAQEIKRDLEEIITYPRLKMFGISKYLEIEPTAWRTFWQKRIGK